MPIKPENVAKYPPDWNAIRDWILRRALERCEFTRADGSRCDAPNGALIGRLLEDREKWWPFDTAINYMDSSLWYPVKVVLTVAHLNHNPFDCRDENLRAGCQLHHLRYDLEHHQETAAATRRLKMRNLELFPDLTAASVEADTAST